MKKQFAILMICSALLTLISCGNKSSEDAPALIGAQTQEFFTERAPQLTKLPELQIPAKETVGRLPSGGYTLPEERIDLIEWELNGAVGLLAEEDDVAFYAVEGKENSLALLRWGEILAEFDWLYITPRAIEPELRVCDLDSDGAEEVVVDCYGGSGTGVSIDYLYVVEKDDNILIACELPWQTLRETLNTQLQTIIMNGGIYAALGLELVDITAALEDMDSSKVSVCLGQVVHYDWNGRELTCSLGVMAEGDGIPPLFYVATVEAILRYDPTGVFTLTEIHLSGN